MGFIFSYFDPTFNSVIKVCMGKGFFAFFGGMVCSSLSPASQ